MTVYLLLFLQTFSNDGGEIVVMTSVLSFMLRGPKSAKVDENDNNISNLVCRSYNPAIKTLDHHYVESKISLDVQCELITTQIYNKT